MPRKKQTTEEVNVTNEELNEAPATVVAQEVDDNEEFVVPDTGEEESVPEQVSEEEKIKSVKEGNKNKELRGVVAAGKKAKRKLYNNGMVYTKEDGLVRQNISNSERRKEYLEIVASAKAGKILTGVCKNYRETENGQVLACINFGKHFIVDIPAERFCDLSQQPPEVVYDLEHGTSEARNYRLKMIIQNRFDSEVSFIVRYADERTGLVFGDHLMAMSRECREYYTARHGNSPTLRPGMNVEAQIVQTNRIGVWVECFGAEAFITADEIDWLRRADISEQYQKGQKVFIHIMEVHPHQITQDGKITNVIKLKASIKQMTDNPNELYFDKYQEGQHGIAEVTQITDKGVFVIFANKISVLCSLPGREENPDIGDRCDVSITLKEKDGFLFWGRISRVYKKPI
ncbi:MAG: S1 RNA-binding domain-containing protein [Butyrivibrio sp.]|uniref:S1 RNA-binding domain-containing protein n=1 Tax=Butyrivibrio sp. TaxID=28121 RepID=UPI001B781772|nr:S1 RNA-binding domain-containing protein [Butyrivibrio sp.]MBP3784473.1 S1 RNA-binding domain-containing protein [Butyrivibrio sp.]